MNPEELQEQIDVLKAALVRTCEGVDDFMKANEKAMEIMSASIVDLKQRVEKMERGYTVSRLN